MLPSQAAGGGATSFYKQVRSADALRRQRTSVLLGLVMTAFALPLILQTLVVREGVQRLHMASLLGALGALSAVGALLARRGHGGLAGLWLTAIPCVGSVVTIVLTRQLGAAALYGTLGVVIAMVTLQGRWLRAALAFAVGSTLLIVVVASGLQLEPTPPALTLGGSVVLVVLIAVIVALETRSFARLIREAAEQQSRTAELEARFRLVAENSAELVALVDEQGNVTWASPSFERVLGVAPVGQPVAAIFSDEVDRRLLEGLLTRARTGQAGREEVRRTRRDGSVGRFDCAISAIPERQVLLCVARDVTAERVMSAELEQARKMEALGRFAGSIAHDFNNLLSVIRTCTTLALQAIPAESGARADLHDVQEAVSRASGLTAQLLAFSRRDVVLPARVEVEPLLRKAAELSRRLLGEAVRVEVEIADGLWPISCGPSQLDQIVMNLAANARDAMPHGGTFLIAASNVSSAPIGDAVQLIFKDDGSGMSAEARAHLFEPFYTTKPPGIGTGLGLATVFGVVKGLGGTIEVESEDGRGTQFRVVIPRAVGAAAPTVPEVRARAIARPSDATVLVVDDDADVRALMVRLISQEGFQVLSAANADQALAMALTLSALPVLVTDVMLPGRDGVWLAKRLIDRFPGLQVVMVSGFAPDPQGTMRLIDEGARFLQKPFAPGALVQAIREALGLPAAPRAREVVVRALA
ncbi:MAG: ATP-binding protein [Myxococcota bacterium]